MMTELRHGSNVAGLQTEAVLDTGTDEWIINTPDDGAIKWYVPLRAPVAVFQMGYASQVEVLLAVGTDAQSLLHAVFMAKLYGSRRWRYPLWRAWRYRDAETAIKTLLMILGRLLQEVYVRQGCFALINL